MLDAVPEFGCKIDLDGEGEEVGEEGSYEKPKTSIKAQSMTTKLALTKLNTLLTSPNNPKSLNQDHLQVVDYTLQRDKINGLKVIKEEPRISECDSMEVNLSGGSMASTPSTVSSAPTPGTSNPGEILLNTPQDVGYLLVEGSKFREEVGTLQEKEILEDFPIGCSIPKVDPLPEFSNCFKNSSKRVLILDLDNTLVLAYPGEEIMNTVNIVNTVNIGSTGNNISDITNITNITNTENRKQSIYHTYNLQIPFLLRPEALSFLKSVHREYHIIIFTAGESSYARDILQTIEVLAQQQLFSFYYSRDHLGHIKGSTNLYIKRLIHGIPERNIAIVDDSFLPWFHSIRNYIPVSSWRGDINDSSLSLLLAYLGYIRSVPDLRDSNDAYLQLTTRIHRILGVDGNTI